MKNALSCIVIFLFAAFSFGQAIKIDGEVKTVQVDQVITTVVKKDVLVVQKFPVTLTAPAGGFLYQWTLPPGVVATKKLNVLVVTSASKGDCIISAEWIVVDFKAEKVDQKYAEIAFSVGEPGPPPPLPPPPPPPDPPPIPEAGFRVLIVYESSALGSMPSAQRLILSSQQVRGYLSDKCAKEPDGKSPAWRVYDKDADLSKDLPTWKNAMARPRVSVPWLIVSDGKSGYEGPLPATIADMLTLLKKWGA